MGSKSINESHDNGTIHWHSYDVALPYLFKTFLLLINVLRSFLSLGHAAFVRAAPNEPEGPGGKSDGRSAYETDVRAPQKLEAAEMRGDERVVVQCLHKCIQSPDTGRLYTFAAFRRCMMPCLGI